jgi:hypothetical protein
MDYNHKFQPHSHSNVSQLRQSFERSEEINLKSKKAPSNWQGHGVLVEHLELENRHLIGNNEYHPVVPSGVTLPPWGTRAVIESEIEKQLKELKEEEEMEDEDPLQLAEITYQDTTLVPLIVNANIENIWDWCVGYCAIAMARRGDAKEMFNIGTPGPNPVGLYYFTAVSIFYNIYLSSTGEVPILQMVSKEFRNLMHAASAVTKNERAYTVEWPNDILTIIQSLPFNSFTNPLITLAQQTGAEDALGRPILATGIPVLTLPILDQFGGDAFEIVQRYFLFTDGGEPNLVPITQSTSYFTNTSMFAVRKTSDGDSPVNGVYQVINETFLPNKDYWLIALGFYSSADKLREGWQTKTIQRGTHLALMRLLQDGGSVTKVNKVRHNMINLSLFSMRTLGALISAEYQARDQRTNQEIVGSIDFGFLSTITPGQFMAWATMALSRRFNLAAAMQAGTPPIDPSCTVFGAGSRYLTTMSVDQGLGPRCSTESLGDLSAFYSLDGTQLDLPMPVIRGDKLSASFQLGTENLRPLFNLLFPSQASGGGAYEMAAPGPLELPSTMSFLFTDAYASCNGSAAKGSLEAMNGMLTVLQAQLSISTLNANRDGPKSHHLNMCHYLADNPPTFGYDTSYLNNTLFLLSRGKLNGKELDTRYTSFVPVMYGDVQQVPSFQVLYDLNHRTNIQVPYLEFCQGVIEQFGHKRGSAPWSGDNSDLHYFRSTIMGNGGNFMSSLLAPDGIVHSGAKLLADGLLGWLFPKKGGKGSAAKAIQGKSPKEIETMVQKGSLHPAFLDVVGHGLVSHNDFMSACHAMLTQQPTKKTPKKSGYVQRKSSVSTRGAKSKRVKSKR